MKTSRFLRVIKLWHYVNFFLTNQLLFKISFIFEHGKTKVLGHTKVSKLRNSILLNTEEENELNTEELRNSMLRASIAPWWIKYRGRKWMKLNIEEENEWI